MRGSGWLLERGWSLFMGKCKLTDGGREEGKAGLGRGSSSLGKVEKVNWGVCVYFQASDYCNYQH